MEIAIGLMGLGVATLITVLIYIMISDVQRQRERKSSNRGKEGPTQL